MTDFDKIRAILDAATPGPWGAWIEGYRHPFLNNTQAWGGSPLVITTTNSAVVEEVSAADARAIVVARNLAPEWNAVAEAATVVLQTSWPVAGMSDLAAALDALHAKMKETL